MFKYYFICILRLENASYDPNSVQLRLQMWSEKNCKSWDTQHKTPPPHLNEHKSSTSWPQHSPTHSKGTSSPPLDYNTPPPSLTKHRRFGSWLQHSSTSSKGFRGSTSWPQHSSTPSKGTRRSSSWPHHTSTSSNRT